MIPASAVGEEVRLRWRYGSDTSVAGGDGWFIDSMEQVMETILPSTIEIASNTTVTARALIGEHWSEMTTASFVVDVPVGGDFNDDSSVNGADFLAWQRGFGIFGVAKRTDGDADNDGDVDADDLSVWQSTYGQFEMNPLVTAATDHQQSPANSAGRANTLQLISEAALVDAAVALDSANKSAPEAAALLVEEAFIAAHVDRTSATSNVLVNPAHVNDIQFPSIDQVTNDDQSETQWLADEMLEAVFG